jgi:integrase
MSRASSGAAAVERAAAVAPPVDWRLARMASLLEGIDLGEEWDPERLLVVVAPGGRLTGRGQCTVAGCTKRRDGAAPVCDSHKMQFARSGSTDLDAWLEDGARPLGVYLSLERCQITDRGGECCGRPAGDPQGLCDTHSQAFHVARRRGGSFEEFVSKARPLAAIGPCVAASCFLEAINKQHQLCRVHYVGWLTEGRPGGRAFERFAARVRQPVSGHILSLRGLHELTRLELLYGIGCRVTEKMATEPWHLRRFVDLLRTGDIGSVTEFDVEILDGYDAYARYVIDRVRLAYADPAIERERDRWDLRVFGHLGTLDFTGIRQEWLREALKAWAASALGGVRSSAIVRSRLDSMRMLSAVLASGPGGGEDPAALGRGDMERFLSRVSSFRTRQGRPYSARRLSTIVEDVSFVLRQARETDLLADLPAAFAVRRGDLRRRPDDEPGRALPAQVIAILDAHTDLLRTVPATWPMTSRRVLGERAGEMGVLVYLLLKSTGRRRGEIASLRLECLEVDGAGRPVLVYDNHKRQRMARRLPIADSALVQAIRDQQAWVKHRFPDTLPAELWLLPRASRNSDGRAHLSSHHVWSWITTWIERIPTIDVVPAGIGGSEPIPFDRSAIHPHAFRHTYAQTLADQGVPAPVLRDLMDHRSIDTTLGYFNVGESRKREAMELLARHTVDNRGITRVDVGEPSALSHLHEQLSWVAVPMGKCSEPTNVRAGGGDCPIRYQCAGCPHFESDPSYLPELLAYADDLRKEREAMLAAGAAEWAVEHVARQLDVVLGHIATHEALLDRLASADRSAIEEASVTLRKARQSVPVAFGRRRSRD